MGVVKKLANTKLYERGANYELGQSLNSSSVATLFGNGGTRINVLEEYAGYVWKSVSVRAEDLASQRFFVERKVGDKWQADESHPFNDVLEGVEGGNDLSETLEAHQTCMDMYGEAFWYFSKIVGLSQPYAVYILDPSCVTIFVSGERVTGYKYDKEDLHIMLDLDEVEHFRAGFNPSNRFRGVGPMQKAGWFIRSSRYVTTYVNNFLENNAIPAGVIVSKDQVNDDDWKLFKEEWANKYSGIDNAGKTGFVRGDLQFVKTGLSLGEVDFSKIKESSRDDILAMFSMPKSKLGLYEDMNKASSLTSDTMFAKTFTQQAVRRITRKLTRYVGGIYGEQFRFGTDFALPEDDEQKLSEYKAFTNVAVTVNETREAYGFPKLPGTEYDTLPVHQVVAADGTPVKALVTPKSMGKITIRTKNGSGGFSYEMKEDFRSEAEQIQLKYEQQFLQASNKVLTDQKERVLEQIKPKKLLNANLDQQKEADALVEATLAVELSLALDQGNLAAAFVGGADAKFEVTPVMEKYIRDSLAKSSFAFTKETLDKVAALVAQGVEAGDSLPDISKGVSKLYDEATGVKTPGYRIERLARTEVIKTSNEITESAYVQSGVVKKKEWFANPGCCEYCAALKGSIINLGSTFVAKGSTQEGVDGGTRVNDYEDVNHPPTHPACRCTLIPVVEG